FLFYCSRFSLHLPSFPTRRSSDLSGFGLPSDFVLRNSDFRSSRRKLHRLSELFSLAGATRGSLYCVRFSGATRHVRRLLWTATQDRKSTRLNSSHVSISYAVFCLK